MADHPSDDNRVSADQLRRPRPEVERLALSLHETAEALSISRRKVQQLVTRREIPFARVDRRLVFPIDQLREWLADRVEGGL